MSKERCPFKDECPFYRKPDYTAAIKVLREIYCHGDPSKCEILTKYIHGNSIPENMLPDGTVET